MPKGTVPFVHFIKYNHSTRNKNSLKIHIFSGIIIIGGGHIALVLTRNSKLFSSGLKGLTSPGKGK